MMRKLCIINHKGGVGKTTTTIHLAHGLAAQGKDVLLLDLDPQGNVSTSLGLSDGFNIYDFLMEEKPFERCIRHVNEHLDVMPTRETLTKAEMILAGEQSRETYLRRKLRGLEGYDYVLLDCPPSLGLLNQNALLYADEAVIPTATDPLGVDALRKMLEAIETVNEVFDHSLRVSAVVPTLYDARLKSCKESLDEIHALIYGVVTQPVRMNAKLREAPKHAAPVFSFARTSRGAADYAEVVRFIVQHEKQELAPAESVQVRA